MQKFKRQSIDYLLTDLLPVEKGMHYTHTYLYHYLEKNINEFNDIKKSVTEKDVYFDPKWHAAPLHFNTKKKKLDFRKLSYLNPVSLVQALIFIEIYNDELVGVFRNKESFSMRHPDYTNDLVYKTIDQKRVKYASSDEKKQLQIMLEASGSFFKVKPHKTITKYMTSRKHLKGRENFDQLLKLDIQNCFGSIYTHSYKWTVSNKTYDSKDLLKSNSLPKNIDAFLQNLNGSKTNGIIVGPEMCRMLAEYLLVDIDNRLIDILNSKGCFNQQDYCIQRYVDDYFIFTNDFEVQQLIQQELKLLLIEFQLTINTSKSEQIDNKTSYSNKWLIELADVMAQLLELFNSKEDIIKESLGILLQMYPMIPETDGRQLKKQDVFDKLKNTGLFEGDRRPATYQTLKNETLAVLHDTNEPVLVSSYLLTIILRKIEECMEKKQTLSSELSRKMISYVMFLYSLNMSYDATLKVVRIFTLVLDEQVNHAKENISYELEKYVRYFETAYVSDWNDIVLFMASYQINVSKSFMDRISSLILDNNNPVTLSSLLIVVDSSLVQNKVSLKRKINNIIRENVSKINWNRFFEDPLSWWIFIFFSYPNLNKALKKQMGLNLNKLLEKNTRILNKPEIIKSYKESIVEHKKKREVLIAEKKTLSGLEQNAVGVQIQQVGDRIKELGEDMEKEKRNIESPDSLDALKTEIFLLKFLLLDEIHFIEWSFEAESFLKKFYFYTKRRTIFNPKYNLSSSY